MQLLVTTAGAIRTLYDETLDLNSFGSLTVSRGSLVEPNDTGEWFVDLAPVQGPQLGPFTRRSAALTAEVDWLQKHWLIPTASDPADSA